MYRISDIHNKWTKSQITNEEVLKNRNTVVRRYSKRKERG